MGRRRSSLRTLHDLLSAMDGARPREVKTRANISGRSLYFHLSRFQRAGLVTRTPDGLCVLTQEGRLLRSLLARLIGAEGTC